MSLIEKAYEFASRVHRKEDFEKHVKVVYEIAMELAERMSADPEVVALSSLLHDIGRVMYDPATHEVTGAEEATKFLEREGAEKELIAKVRECILLHRSSKRVKTASKEVICLRVADALSHFVKIWYMLYLLKLYDKPLSWLINKLRRDISVLEEHGFMDLSEKCRKILSNIEEIEKLRAFEELF